MKMTVKMAVLLATLFLLAGMAFADCYEVTYINVDDPTDKVTLPATIEVNYDLNIGAVCSGIGNLNASLFFDSSRDQALGYNDNCWGYIKFHGDNLYILKGISYCDGGRYTVSGHKSDVDCPSCECNTGCPIYWLGDDYCDAECNVSECNYDFGDCD